MAKSLLSEELQVLFHAALLGRSDIIKNAIASYRSTGKSSPEDIANFVSTIRPEDGATPLHVAAHGNHSDAIRTLLNAGARLDIIATEGIFQGKLPYELSSDATKQTTFHVYLFEQIAIGNVPPIPLRVAVNAPPIQPSRPYHSLYMERLATEEVQVDNNGPIVKEGVEEEVMLSPSPESSDLTPPPPPLHQQQQQQNEEEIEDEKVPKKDLFSVLYGRSSGVGGEEGDAPLPGSSNKPPTYIFWPPVRQQQRHPNLSPLKLSSAENTLICISSAEVDIFPLLLSSGLIEVMDNFGLQALKSNSKPYISSCNRKKLPEWYRGIPIASKGKSEPLIAILAATTSHKIDNFSTLESALHNKLIRSIRNTVECGFRYVLLLGYDIGDKHFDNNSNRKALEAFVRHDFILPLKAMGIHTSFSILGVDNPIQKPVPVFNAMAVEAYHKGADFFYRINDDTILATGGWTSALIYPLLRLDPPLFGVVGPRELNEHTPFRDWGFAEHDFVHRTHMEVFQMSYYPTNFTDYGCDVWIFRVYGRWHTMSADSVFVLHDRTHGTRYEPNAQPVDEQVSKGRELIHTWILANRERITSNWTEFADRFRDNTEEDNPLIWPHLLSAPGTPEEPKKKRH
eukprot:gene27333-36092_t